MSLEGFDVQICHTIRIQRSLSNTSSAPSSLSGREPTPDVMSNLMSAFRPYKNIPRRIRVPPVDA